MTARRFWFRFRGDGSALPGGVALGCGVTAMTRFDAERILRESVFRDGPFPAIASITEDVDVSTLDANHVLTNMGDVLRVGVWFPLGYS